MTLPYLHIYLFAAHLFRRIVSGSFLFARVVGSRNGQCNATLGATEAEEAERGLCTIGRRGRGWAMLICTLQERGDHHEILH
jgi:hypothetical protein